VSELTWARPWLWPFLLLLPVLWLALWGALRHARAGIAAYGATLRERVPRPGGRASLLTALAALLLLSFMNPQLGTEQVRVERKGLDVIFCLDTSRSMLARDAEPTRLGRAKRDIQTMLPLLVGGDRVGLVAFAGEARLVVPLTHDADSFRYLAEQVDTETVHKGGSDLAAALRKALDLAEDGEEATTVILLLTDGEDLTGAGRQAAEEVASRGITLHAIGYGSTRGSKITIVQDEGEAFLKSSAGDEVVSVLDADGLRRMAETAGGEFLRADVMPLPLVELKHKRIDPMLKRSYDAGEDEVRKTRFQWVLLPGVLLLLLEILTSGGARR